MDGWLLPKYLETALVPTAFKFKWHLGVQNHLIKCLTICLIIQYLKRSSWERNEDQYEPLNEPIDIQMQLSICDDDRVWKIFVFQYLFVSYSNFKTNISRYAFESLLIYLDIHSYYSPHPLPLWWWCWWWWWWWRWRWSWWWWSWWQSERCINLSCRKIQLMQISFEPWVKNLSALPFSSNFSLFWSCPIY